MCISATDTEYLRERIHIPETPCWVWRGYIRDHGYGVWGRNDSGSREAHRRSYELLVGPIPVGMEVHHRCFNRSCVNPEHLELLTHGENLAESRSVGAVNSARTHCVNGHPFDEANTYVRISPSGRHWRQCRVCRNDSVRKIMKSDPNYGRLDRECKNGHSRTPENTEIRGGHRRCRLCRIEGKRKPGGYKDPNRKRATHCPHGHEFSPENTYVSPDGRVRYCRECNRRAKRR